MEWIQDGNVSSCSLFHVILPHPHCSRPGSFDTCLYFSHYQSFVSFSLSLSFSRELCSVALGGVFLKLINDENPSTLALYISLRCHLASKLYSVTLWFTCNLCSTITIFLCVFFFLFFLLSFFFQFCVSFLPTSLLSSLCSTSIYFQNFMCQALFQLLEVHLWARVTERGQSISSFWGLCRIMKENQRNEWTLQLTSSYRSFGEQRL